MIAEIAAIATGVLGALGGGGIGFAIGKKIEKTKGGKEFDNALKEGKDTVIKMANRSNPKKRIET